MIIKNTWYPSLLANWPTAVSANSHLPPAAGSTPTKTAAILSSPPPIDFIGALSRPSYRCRGNRDDTPCFVIAYNSLRIVPSASIAL